MGHPVDGYAQAVVDGQVPAGTYHRLACVRHLRDRAREAESGPWVFSADAADRFFRFASKLRHYKGEWAGQPFVPSDNQVFRLGNIFGWRSRTTGLRRFTTAYNELPRKSGKTFEAAVVALYVTFFEGEPGAEGYCIATKREQARRVWDDCKRLVVSSGLKARITAQVANLHQAATACKLEPLGADADSTDGLNPHLIITDELHAMKTRALLDVMESATGARRNPLHYQITTAGDDPVSPCGDQHDYACKVLDGVFEDAASEAFFAFIAHADPDDDWLDEATWRKANPHYGISVLPEDLRKLALKAKQIPSAVAEFQQKRLNLWVNTAAPSLSVDGWRRGQTTWDEDELRHEPCWAGLDLSGKLDLTALTLLFPPAPGRPRWRLLQRIWTPAETLIERARRDRAPYDVWAEQGWLLTTPGSSIDQRVIQDELRALRQRFDIEMLGYDPWHAHVLARDLVRDDGWREDEVIEVPQTFAGLTKAESDFKALVVEGEVDARGCPVTAWCVSNVVEQTDGKGNILFTKKRSRGRIDPVKSATIALSVYLRQPRASEPTFFVVGGRV